MNPLNPTEPAAARASGGPRAAVDHPPANDPPEHDTDSLSIGFLVETVPGENRVALAPESVQVLAAAGRVVRFEAGAGVEAHFPDTRYTAVGASPSSRTDVLAHSDVIVVVRPPDPTLVAALRPEQVLIGLVDPLNHLTDVQDLAGRGVTVVAFELLPRTLSRAQAMDALSSQASAAGYRAALVAATAFGRYLPMMITAAGTATPAKVVVIGAGVAGLQAIATTKRLGAIVSGYDVRPASRGEVESLGATFLTPSVTQGSSSGGYARAMTDAEAQAQQDELAAMLGSCDVIITTAKVPGHTPPLLVTADTLATLRPGSVCVDLGASDLGGNIAGSIDREQVLTPEGVLVIGGGELAADLPSSSSQMYGRNVAAVIATLFPAEVLVVDPDDEVHQHIVICTGGAITNDAVHRALEPPVDAELVGAVAS